MSRKVFCLCLVILLVLPLLPGCGSSSPPAEKEKITDTSQRAAEPVDTSVTYRKEVVIGTDLEIMAPNSYLGSGPAMNQQAELLYSRLVEVDKLTRELIPDAAVEWGDVSEKSNFTVWEFKLREGMTFHNGNSLTADDIIYSWECAHDATIAPNVMSATTVFEIEKLDDYTVRFHMSDPEIDFPRNARLMFIVDKETCTEQGFEKGGAIGTGPYKFENWTTGVEYSYTKFADYYDADNVATERLVFKPIPDSSTRLVALQTGEIDIMANVDSTAYDIIKQDGSLQLISRKGYNTYMLNFCCDAVPAMQDLRVRQAINHALNRDEIIAIAFTNLGEAWNCVASPSIPGSIEVKGYEYNPEKARELLADAGYGKGLTLKCIHWGGVFDKLAAIAQAQLAEVGINMDVEQVDSATFNTIALKGETPLFFSYNGSTVTDIFSSIFSKCYSSGSAFNPYWTTEPEFDALLEKAQASIDEEERFKIAAELCQMLDDYAVNYSIAVAYITFAAKAEVEGLIVDVSIPTMDYSTVRIPEV